MRRILLAAVVGILLAFVPGAAASTIVTGPVNITADGFGDNEVDVAINPTNPRNLLAEWNDYASNSCGIGTSFNGGRTWTLSFVHGIDFSVYDYGAGDPSVGFLNDGTAVLACNAWSIKKPTALFTSYSTDGGLHWAPVQKVAEESTLGKNLDHPMLTIDRYSNRVLLAYTTWNGNFHANSWGLVSSDNGRTYQGPYQLAADYKSNSPDIFDVSLAGAPGGTIYAVTGIWQHTQVWNEQAVVVSRLRPGETAFTHSVKVRDLVPMPMNLPGEQWRTTIQPSIGVEPSGTVDVLLDDSVTGSGDMYLARSTDGGATWPGQVDLTHNRPGHDVVMPWLSVAPNGRLDTIFYDYNEATGLMDVDYGQISGGSMSTLVLQHGIDGDAQPPRGPGTAPFWGDYNGIDSTSNLVALTWTCNGPQSSDACAATVRP